jgi:hypothetical protein
MQVLQHYHTTGYFTGFVNHHDIQRHVISQRACDLAQHSSFPHAWPANKKQRRQVAGCSASMT